LLVFGGVDHYDGGWMCRSIDAYIGAFLYIDSTEFRRHEGITRNLSLEFIVIILCFYGI